MSYGDVQTGAINIIKKLDNYADKNVSEADYRILNHGFGKAIVFRPGAFAQERTEFSGGIEATWAIIIELYIKYQDDAQVQSHIRDERQDIIDKFNEYPKLGGSANHAIITAGAEPVPVFDSTGGGPHFLMQEMTLEAEEYLRITEVE